MINNLSELLSLIITSIICIYCFFSGIDINVRFVIALCAILVLIIPFLSRTRFKVGHISIVWFINILLTSIYADSFSGGTIDYNVFILVLLFFHLIISSNSERIDARRILNVIMFFSVISVVILLFEVVLQERMLPFLSFFLSNENYYNEVMRIRMGSGFSGLAEFPNVISMATVIIFFYSAYLMKKKNRLLRMFLLFISTASLILASERSNFFMIPFSFFFTYYIGEKQNNFLKALKIMFIVIFGAVLFISLRSSLYQIVFFSRIYDTIDLLLIGDDFSNGRLLLYSTAISLWKQNFYLGNRWFYFFNHNRGILGRDTYVHVHNLILELLCDVGVIGLCIIIIPIIVFLGLNIKALRIAPAERKNIFKFTLAMQTFFLLDSMLHVTFFSTELIPFYFITMTVFFSIFNKKYDIKDSQLKSS